MEELVGTGNNFGKEYRISMEGKIFLYSNGTPPRIAFSPDAFTFDLQRFACKIGDQTYDSISAAVAAAQVGDTIVMTEAETISEDITINKNITLDLAGQTITTAKTFKIDDGATFTLNDSKNGDAEGEIEHTGSSVLFDVGTDKGTEENHASFIMNGGSITENSDAIRFNGSFGSAIVTGGSIKGSPGDCVWFTGSSKNCTFSMTGGTLESKGDYATIYSNGNSEGNRILLSGDAKVEYNTTQTLTEDYITQQLSKGHDMAAIYAARVEKLSISDNVEITSNAATLEIRDGELEVTGGTITNTFAGDYISNSNKNGLTSLGSAITIAQHTTTSTKKPVTVNISGENTTITGNNALAIANPQNNESTVGPVEVTIDGATLTSTKTDGTGNNGNAILADNANVNINVNSGDLTGNVTVAKKEGVDDNSNTNNTSLKMNGGTTTGNVVNAGSNTSNVEIGGETSIKGDVTSSGKAPTTISGGTVGGKVENSSATATTNITGGTVNEVSSSAGNTKVSGTATVKDTVTTSGGTTDISGSATVATVTTSGGTTNVTGAAKVTTVTNSDSGTTNVSGGTVKNVTSSGGTTNVSGSATITTVTTSGGTTNVSGGTITTVTTSDNGKTNVTDGTVQTLNNTGESATTNLSGGTVQNVGEGVTIPDGYTKGTDGIVRVNGAWSLSGSNYQYVVTGSESHTVIASASGTTTGGLDDTQYKLLAIPKDATLTWNEGASSITSLFSAAQYSTNAGAIEITPLKAGFKIIGTAIVGDATTTLTTSDDSSYGIAVDATNNSLLNITGGKGADNLNAGNKNATLFGGEGDDTLAGGSGNASLNGGEGDDTFIYTAGKDTINGFAEGDIVKISGAAVTDGSKITSSGDNFTLDFGDGKTLTFTDTSVPVTINNDAYDYIYTKDLVKQGTSVTLAAGLTSFDASTSDSLSSVENIDASAVTGNIAIIDNALSNNIISNGNLKFNYSKGGNDVIENYDIDGDVISLGAGFTAPTDFTKATFDGSNLRIGFTTADKALIFKSMSTAAVVSNNDTYTYAGHAGGKLDYIALNSSSGNGISLGTGYTSTQYNGTGETYATINASNVTRAIRIRGNDDNNYIVGSNLGGTLEGNDGDDTLYGSGATDSLTLNGGDGNDLLIGGTGYNYFVYGEGSDSISGYNTGDVINVTGRAVSFADVTVGTSSNDLLIEFDSDNQLSIAGGASTGAIPISIKSGRNNYAVTKDYFALNDKSITLTSAYDVTEGDHKLFNGADKPYQTINAGLVTGDISIVGNANNNYIVGGTQGNSLAGGDGDDTLVGGSLTNLFYYTKGKDVIENFDTNDKLAIDADLVGKITSGKLTNSRLTYTIDKKSDVLTFKFGDNDPIGKVSLEGSGYLTKDGVVSVTSAAGSPNSLKLFGNAKGRIDLNDELYSIAGASAIATIDASTVKSQSVTLVGGTQDGVFKYYEGNKQRDGFEYGGGSATIIGYEGGRDRIDLNGIASLTSFKVTNNNNDVELTTSKGTISITGAKDQEVLLRDTSRGYKKMVFAKTGVVQNKKNNPTMATVSTGADNYSAGATIKKIFVTDVDEGRSIQAGDRVNTIIDARNATHAVSLSGGEKNDKLIGSNQADLFTYTAGKDVIQGFGTGDSISLANKLKDSLDAGKVKITAAKKSIKFKFSNKEVLTIKSDETMSGALNINGEEKIYFKNAIGEESGSVSLTSAFSGTFRTQDTRRTALPTATTVKGSAVEKNLTFKGSSDAETLIGGGKSNKKTMFRGGGGADSLVAGASKDTFFYAKGDEGNATISNFAFGTDKLKVSGGIINNIKLADDKKSITFGMTKGKSTDAVVGSFNITSGNKDGNVITDFSKVAIKTNNTYYWFAESDKTYYSASTGEDIAAGTLITTTDKLRSMPTGCDAVLDLNYSTNLTKNDIVAVKVTTKPTTTT